MPWVRYRTTRSRCQQCREPGAGWDSRRRHSFGEAIFGGRGPCCDTGPATGWPGFSAAAAVPSVGGGLKSSSCAGKPDAAGGESGGCRDIRAVCSGELRVCSGELACMLWETRLEKHEQDQWVRDPFPEHTLDPTRTRRPLAPIVPIGHAIAAHGTASITDAWGVEPKAGPAGRIGDSRCMKDRKIDAGEAGGSEPPRRLSGRRCGVHCVGQCRA